MKKGKVKVYELNSDGKYIIKDDIKNFDDQVVEDRIDCLTLDKKENTEGLPKEVFNSLFTNPFLFIKNDENNKYVTSLEDFYVTYKHVNESLGAILRSDRYRNNKKKKLFKKQFKIWRIDATKESKDTFKNAEESLQIAKENKPIQTGFGIKFGLILGIIIPLFLLLHIVSFLLITDKVIKIIAYFIIGFSVLGLILASIQDIKIYLFKEYITKQKRIYKKYLKEVNKNLKKKTKKVYNYYCKALSKKKFKKAPVPIDKITIGGDKVEYLKKQTEVLNKKCVEMLKKNKRFNGLYSFPLLLSVFASIPSVGYLIYLCILKLIDYFK